MHLKLRMLVSHTVERINPAKETTALCFSLSNVPWAKYRRLFFESHALSLQDLKSRRKRTESSEARTIPLPEKMERLRQIKTPLNGLTFTPIPEPSHRLVDRVAQQMEDVVVAYIELSKCTSR